MPEVANIDMYLQKSKNKTYKYYYLQKLKLTEIETRHCCRITRSMSYKKQCKNKLVVFLIFPQIFNGFCFLMLKK